MRCLAIAFAVLALGCGRASHTSDLQSKNSIPFFIVSGGNSSCGTDDLRQRNSPFATGVYQSFSEKIAPHYNLDDIEVLVTCYTDTAVVNFGNIRDPRTILRVSRDEFTKHVSETVERDHLLTHIGHSYGGWLALKTGLDLLDREQNLGHLFTIDPISRENCTFSAPYGCTEAPTDIKPDDRVRLAEATSLWKNFYQTQTWYLHSGPMSQADKNVKIRTSHSNIDKHDTVWTEVLNRVVYQMEEDAFEEEEIAAL